MKRLFVLALPAIVATSAFALTVQSESRRRTGNRPSVTNLLKISILALILGMSASCWGQIVGGAITGVVHDISGAAVSDATVTLTNLETRSQRNLPTNDVGRYSVPSVSVGHYELKVSKGGFQSQLRTGIDIVIGQTVVVDVILSVGNVQEEVTVDEIASPVIISTQQSSGLVSETPSQGSASQWA